MGTWRLKICFTKLRQTTSFILNIDCRRQNFRIDIGSSKITSSESWKSQNMKYRMCSNFTQWKSMKETLKTIPTCFQKQRIITWETTQELSKSERMSRMF